MKIDSIYQKIGSCIKQIAASKEKPCALSCKGLYPQQKNFFFLTV